MPALPMLLLATQGMSSPNPLPGVTSLSPMTPGFHLVIRRKDAMCSAHSGWDGGAVGEVTEVGSSRKEQPASRAVCHGPRPSILSLGKSVTGQLRSSDWIR